MVMVRERVVGRGGLEGARTGMIQASIKKLLTVETAGKSL